MSNCPNCGSNVNQGEVFCRVCGTKLPVPQNNFSNNIQQPQMVNNSNVGLQQTPMINNPNVETQQPQIINNPNVGIPGPQQMNNQNINPPIQNFQQPLANGYVNNITPQTDYIDDEYLIDSYIGKNAERLKNGGFSPNTFFCGFIYVLYRKMWLLGFGWLAVNFIATKFLSSIAGIITIIANIIVSTQFKKLYLKNVTEQVAKIKEENPGKTKEELMLICSKKGGTTLIPVIVVTILYAVVIYFIFMSVFNTVNNAREKMQSDQYYNRNTSNNNNSGVIGDLNMTIPRSFTDENGSSNNYKTFYISNYDANTSNSDLCFLHLSMVGVSSYYTDAQTYLERSIYRTTTDTYSGISQKIINENTWYYATLSSKFSQKYYYSIVNNETIYKLEFDVTSDDTGACSSAYNTVINSLRFN